jgi:hypothetical protein
MPKSERLRAHDVLLACRIFSLGESRTEWTYQRLAEDLRISHGEAHNSADRGRRSGLLLPSREVSRRMLRDLLVVGVPRVFYAVREGAAEGTPTSIYARSLSSHFSPDGQLPLVWPGEGGVRGMALQPLCGQAPALAAVDPVVYELLALVDAVRAGAPDDSRRAVVMLDRRVMKGSIT